MIHIPVLTKEVLQYLNPKSNENFIDCTVGEGGHAKLILEKNKPEGRVLGIDLDLQQIENSRLNTMAFEERIILANDSYANLSNMVQKENFRPVNGILLDLGYSSWQIENSKRGFSFRKDEILDMRYYSEIPNTNDQIPNEATAATIVNQYPEEKIAKILKEYGEERFAKQIAKKITEQRKINKIKTTFELIDIIASAVYGKKYAIPTLAQGQGRGLSIWAKAQIGAKSFQALRIAVNDELNNLIKFLPAAISVLSPKGRLVIISFHSLEDRIVKNFFKQIEKEGTAKILTSKPITALKGEILINPSSRSAKLRAIIKY